MTIYIFPMTCFPEYQHCRLCPRACGVDRVAGDCGVCGETAQCRVASACPHFGEEPPFSGTRGSGTIFFSGCACRCFFCQNYQISMEHQGDVVTPDELTEFCGRLLARGVHNLNFVTPDHFWPNIQYSCAQLRAENIRVPFLWNSSGYQRPELIAEIAETMDIFMPDFKYLDRELAQRCMNAADYPQIAMEALREMIRLKGFLTPFDPSGQEPARSGVLVRHLVLPGETRNSIELLKLLRQEFGRMLPLSIMSQFRPTPECDRRRQFTRTVSATEYDAVCNTVMELDFQQVFLQPQLHDSGFTPDFSHVDNPFPGNRKCE